MNSSTSQVFADSLMAMHGSVCGLGSRVGFNAAVVQDWVEGHHHVSYLIVTAYVGLIFGLKRLMESRAAMDLRWPLALWNVFMAAYSILGLVMSAPEFFAASRKVGMRDSYCRLRGYYEGPMGFWSFLFMVSKIVELGDTLFIVLRKRPLIFLHWYHHVTVLMFTWMAYGSHSSVMRWGYFSNILVHSVMYSYYAARSFHVLLPKRAGMSVTTLQLAQFVLGIYVTSDSLYQDLYAKPGRCQITHAVAFWQWVMYLSYFVLFANFFYQSYIAKPKRATAKKTE